MTTNDTIAIEYKASLAAAEKALEAVTSREHTDAEREAAELKVSVAKHRLDNVSKPITEWVYALDALMASDLFTQDQIDHLAAGMSIAEQLSYGPTTGGTLADTAMMADYSGADCNRFYRALTGNPTIPDADGGYYDQTSDPGRYRALVEVESDDPAAVATNLRAIADALDAGPVDDTDYACGPQNRAHIVSGVAGGRTNGWLCWQRRNEVGEEV